MVIPTATKARVPTTTGRIAGPPGAAGTPFDTVAEPGSRYTFAIDPSRSIHASPSGPRPPPVTTTAEPSGPTTGDSAQGTTGPGVSSAGCGEIPSGSRAGQPADAVPSRSSDTTK